MDRNRMEDRLLGSAGDNEDMEGLGRKIFTESEKLWRIAFPAIVTRVTSFGNFIITQSFMGYIGETELASYALCQILLLRLSNGILLGMASALETFCGQAFGARQYNLMGIYLQRSWVILLIIATLLTPLYIFLSSIFRLLGQEEELSIVAGEISLWFIPVLYYFVFNFTMQYFLQSQLKNMIIGWLSTASIFIHVIVSWLFVIKLNLGIPGAMGAMNISWWFTDIGEFVYVFGCWCPDTWTGFSKSAFSELIPVVKLSLSSGVMLCAEIWYSSILVLLAGYLKNAKILIAALSICLNILAWQFMIFLGFCTAVCVRISNKLGEGNVKAAKFSLKVILTTSVAFGVTFWILTLVFSNSISYLFSSSIEVAKAVLNLSVLLAFCVLINSVQPVLSGVAIGAGWQAVVAYVNIFCYYGIGIPFGLILGYVAHLNVKGIWIGMLSGVAAQTLVLIFITWRTDWDAQVEKAKARVDLWHLMPSEESDESINPA